MYKDIVVPITGTPGDKYALNIALDLAAAHAAHLTVLELVSMPVPITGPMGLVPDLIPGVAYERLREQAQLNVEALRVSSVLLRTRAGGRAPRTLCGSCRACWRCRG